MYRSPESQMRLPDDFFLPFGGKRLGLSDRETVEQITENPYLQYFIVLPEFSEKPPFHPSLMVHFRKRLGPDIIHQVNEWIIAEHEKQDDAKDLDDDPPPATAPLSSGEQDATASHPDSEERPMNQGKLLLDATCAPADIACLTDLSLLNEARGKLEEIIDTLHAAREPSQPKPRTYRKKARKAYLAVAKKRRVSSRDLRKAVGQQLRFAARDLRLIEKLKDEAGLHVLSRRQYRDLLVIVELYRQQEEMYRKRAHRIQDRIVSISQPHVRPIVRGKARTNVEFGAKVSVSLVHGFVCMDRLGWDNFHEGHTLPDAVEAYHERMAPIPRWSMQTRAAELEKTYAIARSAGSG